MQEIRVEGHEPSLLPENKKWKLVWSDEFDGDTLDETKWGFRLNYWGQRAQQFTDQGVSLDGKGNVVFRPVVEDGMVKSAQLQTGENSFDGILLDCRSGCSESYMTELFSAAGGKRLFALAQGSDFIER